MAKTKAGKAGNWRQKKNLESLRSDRGYVQKGEGDPRMRRAGSTGHAAKNPRHRRAKFGRPLRQAGFPPGYGEEDIYICPTGGEAKPTTFTKTRENGIVLHHYWTNACRTCALGKASVHEGPQRSHQAVEGTSMFVMLLRGARHGNQKIRIAMRTRRETVRASVWHAEDGRMGANALSMKTLAQSLRRRMACTCLGPTTSRRVENIVGIKPSSRRSGA